VTGTVSLTSGGGPESRYRAGTVITVPRIIGHTTLGLTACPGGAMIPLIPQIQAAVQKRIKRFGKKRRKQKHKRHGRRLRHQIAPTSGRLQQPLGLRPRS
jgi:hypothetical protein